MMWRILVIISCGISSLLWGLPAAMAFQSSQPSQSTQNTADHLWHIVGTGYRPGTQEVLFYEYHRLSFDEQGSIQTRHVEYRLPDHTLKSVKTIDYSSGNSWTPSFSYEDLQAGYRVGVEVDAGFGRLYRESKGEAYEETRLSISELTVIDAGFDAFIQKVWPRLTQKEDVLFSIFAPLKLDQYDFSIRMVQRVENQCHLEMSLDWWPVELFISPVQLEYDCDTQRLLRYQGITNLRDNNLDQYTADIHYQWFSDYLPFRVTE